MYAHIINKIIKDNSLYNKEEIIKLSSKVILNQFKYDLATRSIISLIFIVILNIIDIYFPYYPPLLLVEFSMNIVNLLYIKYKKLDELHTQYHWFFFVKWFYFIVSFINIILIIRLILAGINIIDITIPFEIGVTKINFSNFISFIVFDVLTYFYYKNKIIQHISNYISDKYYS